MKTIFNLKMNLIKVITLLFLLPSLGGVGGGLYAQDPQLFENLWYLHDLVIDGESNIPPINNEIPFVPAEFIEDGTFLTGMCEEEGVGIVEYIGATEFIVVDMAFFTGGCSQNHPINQNYSGLYIGFWSVDGDNLIYEITVEGQSRTLLISKPNNDYALYKNEVLLSNENFSVSTFLMYPNPVQENLTINNTSNQAVTATLYDVSGKLLKSHALEENISTINVKTLNKGLYFMVIENENGERVSKKFIKK